MRRFEMWWGRRARAGVAVSEHELVAAVNGGPLRVTRRSLPEGLVAPSAATPNISSVSELGKIAADALEELGVTGAPVALALPDLSIATRVVPASARGRRSELLALMSTNLSFPASELRCDFWTGRRGEVLGAAIRGVVVRQYEQIVEAAGCSLGWVDGTCLSRVPAWSEELSEVAGLHLRVQLQRGHYAMAVFVDGELRDLRVKLKSREIDKIHQEILRIPALHGEAAPSSVVVSGDDAEALAALSSGTVRDGDDGDPMTAALCLLLHRRAP